MFFFVSSFVLLCSVSLRFVRRVRREARKKKESGKKEDVDEEDVEEEEEEEEEISTAQSLAVPSAFFFSLVCLCLPIEGFDSDPASFSSNRERERERERRITTAPPPSPNCCRLWTYLFFFALNCVVERVEHSFRSSNGAPPARAESATRFEWFLVYSELHLDEIQVYILMPLIARYRRLRRVDFAGQRASSSASASFRAVFLLQATRRGWPTAASTIFHVDSVEKKREKEKEWRPFLCVYLDCQSARD